jgi:hypothetical protein
MISLVEFGKRYQQCSRKRILQKYKKGLSVLFGYSPRAVPERPLALVDNIVGRLLRKAESKGYVQIQTLLRHPQFIDALYTDDLGDLDDRENQYINSTNKIQRVHEIANDLIPGITETGEFQDMFPDEFFRRHYISLEWNKTKKYALLPGVPILAATKDFTSPVRYFGNNFMYLRLQELYEYARRFEEQRRLPDSKMYSSEVFAQLDLQYTKKIVFPETCTILTYEGCIYILFGETHTPGDCVENVKNSMTPCKFMVDLINACKDSIFDVFLENSFIDGLDDKPRVRDFYCPGVLQNPGGHDSYAPGDVLSSSFYYFFPLYPPQEAWKNVPLMRNARLHGSDIRLRKYVTSFRDWNRIPHLKRIDFINHKYTEWGKDMEETFPEIIMKERRKINVTVANLVDRFFNEEYKTLVGSGDTLSKYFIGSALITDYYGLLRSLRDFGAMSPRAGLNKHVNIMYAGDAHRMQWENVLLKMGAVEHFRRDDSNSNNFTDLYSELKVLGLVEPKVEFTREEQRNIGRFYSNISSMSRYIIKNEEDLEFFECMLEENAGYIEEITNDSYDIKNFMRLKCDCIVSMLEIEYHDNFPRNEEIDRTFHELHEMFDFVEEVEL